MVNVLFIAQQIYDKMYSGVVLRWFVVFQWATSCLGLVLTDASLIN